MLRQNRLATGEFRLVEINKGLQPGVERGVLGAEVRAPGMVGLLHPHRIERVGAEIGHAEIRAALLDLGIKPREIVRRQVQFPAEFAHVGHAHRRAGNAGDLDFAYRHPRHGLGRQVGIA